MPKRKTKKKHSGKGIFFFKGLIAIALGVLLWIEYISLEQAFAIALVLLGLNKIYHTIVDN